MGTIGEPGPTWRFECCAVGSISVSIFHEEDEDEESPTIDSFFAVVPGTKSREFRGVPGSSR